MAKQNLIFFYGRVTNPPNIFKKDDEYSHGMAYLDVVRSLRSVGDNLHFVKHDYPLIISREKEILDAMGTWEANDIVLVKGVLCTQKLSKTSHCPHCNEPNITVGNLVYTTPIYVKKITSYSDKQTAIEDIVDNREISNQAYIYGTLLNDPKIFTTKNKKQIAQYPIAINRKLTIRTDDPSIKTDYPVVKSYGEQARDDKTFLKYQSEIIIDGFLQARTVTRNIKCKQCETFYQWKDNAMEIVPYAVEYIKGHRTPEDVEREYRLSVEELKQELFKNGYSDDLDEDMKTDDIQ